MLDHEQAAQVRHLRSLAHSPAVIAARLSVPVDEVRRLLDEEDQLDGRPVLGWEPLRRRSAVVSDLVSPVEARQVLGVSADTLLRWIRERELPYRDALGRVTNEPYSGRWCSFSLSELERWVNGRLM